MKVVTQTDTQISDGLKPSQWTIRSEMTGGAFKHSIWSGDRRIAADIASLEEAQTVSAAPELLKFVRTILKLARAGADKATSLPEIVNICKELTASAGGVADVANPVPSAGHPTLPSPRRPHQGPMVAAAKTTASKSPSPLFDEVFRSTVGQIRHEAMAAGWTLQRLASELGMSRAQFSRWEKSIPKTVQAVTKLQKVVRTSPSGNSSRKG
jgi:hypothetical protein